MTDFKYFLIRRGSHALLVIIVFINFRAIMGRGCIAAYCNSNSDKKQNISFHRFPNKDKEPERYKQWAAQVKRTRQDWKGPTSFWTFVCSNHFTEDCYEQRPQLKLNLSVSDKLLKQLKPDAVPTHFPRKQDDDVPVKKKPRTAFQKRENHRIINDILNPRQTCSNSIIESSFQTQDVNTDELPRESEPPIQSTVACQTQNIVVKKNTKKIQAVIKVGKKKSTQTETVKMCDQNIQVGDGEIWSPNDSFSSSNISEEVTCHQDTSYEPGSATESEAESELKNDSFNIKHVQPAAEATTTNLLHEPKFIVFWSALQTLLAWVHCPSCHSNEVITSRTTSTPVDGTLLRIQIFCESCGKNTIWKSQPYVKQYAKGNIYITKFGYNIN